MAWVVDTCLLMILIGAFASRFDGILTRNESDFRNAFPTLAIVVP